MKAYESMEAWFITGSQALYGEEVLLQVATDSGRIVDGLNKAGELPINIVFKPVLTTADAVSRLIQEANAAPNCVGLIAWMHTFSPAKMWIRGLSNLSKPFVHLHTQFNRDIPWAMIDMDFINIETFNDAVLLSRVGEDPDYGIANIIRDCSYFDYHMHIDFGLTSLLLIFNRTKDKIYYIEYSRKVVNTDSGNLDEVIDRFISIANERAVKDFLLYHSIGTGVNRIKGVSQTIESYSDGLCAKRVDSIISVKEDMTLGRYSFSNGLLRDYDHIIEGSAGEILYSPREYKNNDIYKQFKKGKVHFKAIGNGIFGNNDHELEGLIIGADSLTISLSLGDISVDLEILINGGPHEFKENMRINIDSGSESTDAFLPFDIVSSALTHNIYQVFDVIVVEFETAGSIAFSFPAIRNMIIEDDLTIGGSISHTRGDHTIMFRSDAVQNVTFESFDSISKEDAFGFYQNDSYDIILDILSREKWENYLDGESNGDDDIPVFTIIEDGKDGVALPTQYTKFFQFKE